MKTFILKRKKPLIGVISAMLCVMLALCFLPSNILKANADETAAPAHTLQETVDSVTFIGWNKAETTENGKMMFTNYFIPAEYFDTVNYTFGIFIVPNDYLSKYELTGDYISQCAEKGISYLYVEASSSYDVTGGKMLRLGLTNVNVNNLDRLMFFCFNVKDNAEGTYQYGISSSASYNGLSTNNQTVDLTNYVSLETFTKAKAQLQAEIDTLNGQIDELEASLTAEGVDMTKFKTLAEYNAKVAELQSAINTLQAEIDEYENAGDASETDKSVLSVKQIIGISAGAALLILIAASIIASGRKRKRY